MENKQIELKIQELAGAILEQHQYRQLSPQTFDKLKKISGGFDLGVKK